MKTNTSPSKQPPKESIDSALAKNLVVSRIISGLTQNELAGRSFVSRATIAQLETGYSDPRLSTIVELAKGLGISPILLLLGAEEVRALIDLPAQIARGSIRILPTDVARMRDLLSSGLLKDRLRAARLGAKLIDEHDRGSAAVAAAIFSAISPGEGTIIGAKLGELMMAGD